MCRCHVVEADKKLGPFGFCEDFSCFLNFDTEHKRPNAFLGGIEIQKTEKDCKSQNESYLLSAL
jgi:hypothetical protein